jgi:hypothetical protein
MVCRECSKKLNDMTLICDSCGATILYKKPQLEEEEFLNKIVNEEYDNKYSKELKDMIRNAYYFTNIRKDFKGSSRKYLDKYIEFTLIRIYYEENKLMLLTRDFSKEISLEIYQTLVNKKTGKKIDEIMFSIYGDDYKFKKIPNEIIKKIDKVFIPNFNMTRVNSNRLFRSSVVSYSKEIIKSFVAFLLIGLTVLLLSSISSSTEVVFDLIKDFEYQIHLIIGLGLVSGTYFGYKRNDSFPIKDLINYDPIFKKHIKIEAEKKLKTIKYRIKKGR